jgi:hypothetical protein
MGGNCSRREKLRVGAHAQVVVYVAGTGLVGFEGGLSAVEPGIDGAHQRGPAVVDAHLQILLVQARRPKQVRADALGQGRVGVGAGRSV